MSAHTKRTPQERLWLAGGVAGALVIAVVGWVFFISHERSETSDAAGRAHAVRLENAALQSRISTLQSQSKDMTDERKTLATAQLALPSTSGVPAFLRTLQSLGSQTGTDVVSLTVGAPTDVSSVAAGSTAGSVAGTATPAPAATSTPAAGTTGSPAAGVYGLAIAAQVNGSPDELNGFLDKLQAVQPRAVLITQITEGGATAGSTSGTSLQLTMQAFVAPSSASERSQLSAASSGD